MPKPKFCSRLGKSVQNKNYRRHTKSLLIVAHRAKRQATPNTAKLRSTFLLDRALLIIPSKLVRNLLDCHSTESFLFVCSNMFMSNASLRNRLRSCQNNAPELGKLAEQRCVLRAYFCRRLSLSFDSFIATPSATDQKKLVMLSSLELETFDALASRALVLRRFPTLLSRARQRCSGLCHVKDNECGNDIACPGYRQ